jgi:hypothetical protein
VFETTLSPLDGVRETCAGSGGPLTATAYRTNITSWQIGGGNLYVNTCYIPTYRFIVPCMTLIVLCRLEQNRAREARNAAFVRQLGTSAASSLESLTTSVQDRLTKAKESYVGIATSVDNVLKHQSQGLKAVLVSAH